MPAWRSTHLPGGLPPCQDVLRPAWRSTCLFGGLPTCLDVYRPWDIYLREVNFALKFSHCWCSEYCFIHDILKVFTLWLAFLCPQESWRMCLDRLANSPMVQAEAQVTGTACRGRQELQRSWRQNWCVGWFPDHGRLQRAPPPQCCRKHRTRSEPWSDLLSF